MSETEPVVVAERSASGAFIGAVVVAVVIGLGALAWCWGLQNHLSSDEQKLAAADKRNSDLTEQLDATNARLAATTETLSRNVGATQKQIDARAQAIMAGTTGGERRDREARGAAAGHRQAGGNSFDRPFHSEDRCGRREDRCGYDEE